jgi:hypothetical protein
LPALERVRKLLREWEASYVDDVTPSGKGTHSQTVGIDDAINIGLAMVHSERSMTIPAAEAWKESIADVDDISAEKVQSRWYGPEDTWASKRGSNSTRVLPPVIRMKAFVEKGRKQGEGADKAWFDRKKENAHGAVRVGTTATTAMGEDGYNWYQDSDED